MLEGNSDRSIWMIGAVIVGIVLVILGRDQFKSIFTKITTWFNNIISNNIEGVEFDTSTVLVPLASVDWASLAQNASTILLH